VKALIVLAALGLATPALAQRDRYVPLPRGVLAQNVGCAITVSGQRLDHNSCTVNTHFATTVFVNDDQSDNGYCTVSFKSGPKGTVAVLNSYKGPCPLAPRIARVTRRADCWVGNQISVCITQRRRAK
jgi:hypothetical protein